MVRPKKKYGQHFLKDENIARKIVGYLSPGTTTVVEVGPGTGTLTKILLENKEIHPFFFEIDPEAVEFLERNLPSIRGKIFRTDFLKADLSFIEGPFTLLGNFPYNISSQILFRVLDERSRVKEVVGMFQKEVAERIAAGPGSKIYGILSVLLQSYYEIEYLLTVPPHLFFPPPRVRSAVIRLRRNAVEKLECNEMLFFRVVKTAFNQRRKTLRNALREFPGLDALAIGHLLGKRAEQLTVGEFVTITRQVTPLTKNS
jgi:16S rRNA (adenine1518-N6/adenine1519-N6)-dimethyltransferase